MSTVAATAGLAALASIGLGWVAGFRAVTPFVVFWASCACVVAAAARVARRFFPDDLPAGSLIRIGTLSFAAVVAVELLLGAVGLVDRLPHIILSGAILA